jgi:hypothetical protein
VLNDTFKTISVIKWQSVELVEETTTCIVFGEYHRHDVTDNWEYHRHDVTDNWEYHRHDVTDNWQQTNHKLYHIMLNQVHIYNGNNQKHNLRGNISIQLSNNNWRIITLKKILNYDSGTSKYKQHIIHYYSMPL